MFMDSGATRVSATIDVGEDTGMHAVVDQANGAIELRLGADSYLFLTRRGAAKLLDTLERARVSGPGLF
ncbi:hypothetical protein [Actinokineospora sp.]|uniref:hypothetical protein n=1 Tax=Actinokineospora sp. TaxID=1872133 RepID=UPI004037B544